MARCNDCGCDMGFFASFGSAICDGCWEKRKQIVKNNLPSNTLDHPPNYNPQSKTTPGTQGVNIYEREEIAQWIYPSKLLSTPQSAFDFPEYPGLSVAMRLYIVIGKVVYFATGVLVPLALLAMFILFISHENGDFAGPRAVLFLVFAVPVLVITLVLMNLGLAFQFASAEIIKVWVRNEENTRTVKKLLEKQTQTEDE